MTPIGLWSSAPGLDRPPLLEAPSGSKSAVLLSRDALSGSDAATDTTGSAFAALPLSVGGAGSSAAASAGGAPATCSGCDAAGRAAKAAARASAS